MTQFELVDGPTASAGKHVLVVDDDPRIRRTLRWALEDDGLEVETAADGRRALERASARRPALVVLDLTLPILDGYDVAIGLRTVYGTSVPILAISADGDAAAKARAAGAYGYLRKPFDLDDLIAAVHRGLAGLTESTTS
ncbi:MAG TPA: response regulator [Chloroflexota bacterium]|nr:response regulator [Chloroflexota bacterium]